MSKAEEKDIIYCGNLRVQASNSFFKLSFLNPHSHNTRVKQAQVKG